MPSRLYIQYRYYMSGSMYWIRSEFHAWSIYSEKSNPEETLYSLA